MEWNKVIGQTALKKDLIDSIDNNRISHAQLFLGKEGYGTLPLILAYVQEIFSRKNSNSAKKIESLNHVDLQISFPFISGEKNKTSKEYYGQFREMILENPYSSLEDWGERIESKNKNFFITVAEVNALLENFSLKSFEGGVKVLIIWRVDKMRTEAFNKFLKFLEEPPENTLIFLIAENSEAILPTILSRTQIIEVPRVKDATILNYLQESFPEIPQKQIESIVQQSLGNLNDAMKIAQYNNSVAPFEDLFIQWVRAAFQVKKKPYYLKDIIEWAKEVASWDRTRQKNLLGYCAEMFRLAMLQSYGLEDMVYKKIGSGGFKWEVFASFLHGANTQKILEEINLAEFHLNRNANSKIVWTDLSIKLSRHIHQ